jgi:DNA topoisomerase-2
MRSNSMTKISVSITDKPNGSFVVDILNDGKGIPVQMHPKENLYVPSLIFGHLLTGSNFDDTEVSLLTPFKLQSFCKYLCAVCRVV